MDNNWYFHNITEEIIYGPIQSDGRWIKSMRELKKKAVIRKLARNMFCDVDGLPDVLSAAIKSHRNEHYGEMRNANMGNI